MFVNYFPDTVRTVNSASAAASRNGGGRMVTLTTETIPVTVKIRNRWLASPSVSGIVIDGRPRRWWVSINRGETNVHAGVGDTGETAINGEILIWPNGLIEPLIGPGPLVLLTTATQKCLPRFDIGEYKPPGPPPPSALFIMASIDPSSTVEVIENNSCCVFCGSVVNLVLSVHF